MKISGPIMWYSFAMIGVGVFWAAVAGFAAGVGVRSLWEISAWCAGLSVLCAAAVLVAGVRKERWVASVALVAFAAGIARMEAGVMRGDPQLTARIGGRVAIEGVISAEPDEREGNTLLTIDAASFASSTKTVRARVLALAPAHSDAAYGDAVTMTGILKAPQPFAGADGRVFDYPGYLAAQGIGYQLEYADVRRSNGWRGNALIAWSLAIKHLFVQGIDRALPEPEAGLAAGIMAGDKRGLGKELTDDFRSVSLVHIIVLSGYNITVVIKGLYEVCRHLRAPRIARFIGGAAIAVFFSCATGLAAASVRASVMALIMITGEWSGRVYRADRALGAAIVGMLLWNPYSLVFDPGFQLSFLATVGLMALSPAISPLVERLPLTALLQEILVATLCAQMAVLPLLLYTSGQLSLVALPANLLALSVMREVMLLTLVAAIAGVCVPAVAAAAALPAYALLAYIIDVARWFAHLPLSTVHIPAFNAWFLAPAYLALAVIAYVRGARLSKLDAEQGAQAK